MKYKLAVTSVVCSWCSLVQYVIVRTNNSNFASLTSILVLDLGQSGAILIQCESPVFGVLPYYSAPCRDMTVLLWLIENKNNRLIKQINS